MTLVAFSSYSSSPKTVFLPVFIITPFLKICGCVCDVYVTFRHIAFLFCLEPISSVKTFSCCRVARAKIPGHHEPEVKLGLN